MALIKREILTSHKVLYTKSNARVISSFFAKRCYSKYVFSRLNCQLKRKKIDTPSFYRFSKFGPTEEWLNKVNLSSFELENFFKFVLA